MTLHPSVQSESPDHGQQRASSRLKRTAPPWLCQALVLSGAGLLGCPPVEADTFRIEPSIGISETLTNNVNLAPSGSARSDLVSQLTPTLSINEGGGRTRLTGSLSMPIVLYARSGAENNQVYAQAALNGTVDAEALPPSQVKGRHAAVHAYRIKSVLPLVERVGNKA